MARGRRGDKGGGSRSNYPSDPVNGIRVLNVMESGLTHTSDSQDGTREGRAVVYHGMPGDPLEKSAGAKSGWAGKVPDLPRKFQREGQF